MGKYDVTIQALREAAGKFEQHVNDYLDATTAAEGSAQTLASEWEGDAQTAFVEEQTRTFQWYRQMAELARAYGRTLESAAAKYEAADAEAAGTIKG